MDVQGSIHATVGILPHRQINIPAEQYTQALQNIEVSFLHAPILTPMSQTQLPLTPIAGFDWTWVEQQQNSDGHIVWDEKFVEKRIEQAAFVDQYNTETQTVDGQQLWQYLLQAKVNWLAVVDDNHDGVSDVDRARVVGVDDRVLSKDPGFTAPFTGLEDTVERLLRLLAVGIEPTISDATFISKHEIREGWLKLRRRGLIFKPFG